MSLLLTSPWEKEFQQWPDAFSPGVFAVLATFDFAILEVFAQPPTLFDQQAFQGARVGESSPAFPGADVQPDELPGFLPELIDVAENYAVAPPHRWRQDRELTEYVGIAQPEIERHQSSER